MILRIGSIPWIPHHFFRKYCMAIQQRRHFPVRGAKVETEPAALQMAAERDCPFGSRRNASGIGDLHGERVFVDARHEVNVEGPRAARRVHVPDVLADASRPTHHYSPATALP